MLHHLCGGFHVQWNKHKIILKEGIAISTLDVLLTTFLVALFCHYIFHFEWLFALLIGSVISCTDAAAVFSILENSNIKLKQNSAEVLEFESGTNDPMAYFLTMSFTFLALQPELSAWSVILIFS